MHHGSPRGADTAFDVAPHTTRLHFTPDPFAFSQTPPWCSCESCQCSRCRVSCLSPAVEPGLTAWLTQFESRCGCLSLVWAIWHHHGTANYKTQRDTTGPVMLIAWTMVGFDGNPLFLVSVMVLPLSNVFFSLFTTWIHRINPTDLVIIPSGCQGKLVTHIYSIINSHPKYIQNPTCASVQGGDMFLWMWLMPAEVWALGWWSTAGSDLGPPQSTTLTNTHGVLCRTNRPPHPSHTPFHSRTQMTTWERARGRLARTWARRI